MRARAWSAWLPPPLISSLVPDVHYMSVGEAASYCEDVAAIKFSQETEPVHILQSHGM